MEEDLKNLIEIEALNGAELPIHNKNVEVIPSDVEQRPLRSESPDIDIGTPAVLEKASPLMLRTHKQMDNQIAERPFFQSIKIDPRQELADSPLVDVLHKAIAANDAITVSMMLNSQDISPPAAVARRDYAGRTALHVLACWGRSEDIARSLLDCQILWLRSQLSDALAALEREQNICILRMGGYTKTRSRASSGPTSTPAVLAWFGEREREVRRQFELRAEVRTVAGTGTRVGVVQLI
jgi:hypothetical protein